MALSTYSAFIAALPNHVARSGDATLAAVLPDLVELFEAKVNYGFTDPADGSTLALRVGDMEANATGTSTNGVFDLPDDFVGWRVLTDPTYGPLSYLEPELAETKYPDGTGDGLPKYFTVKGGTLITYPAIDGTELSLDYYQAIPGISDDNPSNWLLTKRPDIYLIGLKAEIYQFLKNYDEANIHLSLLANLVKAMNGQDRQARYSRTVTRVKGPTP